MIIFLKKNIGLIIFPKSILAYLAYTIYLIHYHLVILLVFSQFHLQKVSSSNHQGKIQMTGDLLTPDEQKNHGHNADEMRFKVNNYLNN